MSAELLSHAFTLGLFRFTLVPRETMFVPAVNKANMLRGAFGHSFRKLCCVPQCTNARECPLASSCPYKVIFEPSPPADADRLRRNQDVPRPFVFRASADDKKTKFLPGEKFQFGLVLIGRALDHLPYFVLSFRDLAAQGIGLNRAKCELQLVEEQTLDSLLKASLPQAGCHTSQSPDHRIFASSDQVFHSPKGLDLVQWIAQRVHQLSSGGAEDVSEAQGTFTSNHGLPDPPAIAAQIGGSRLQSSSTHAIAGAPDHRIRISFLTPTLLKAENVIARSPEFHHVFKRLRDRINSLSTFFGNGPLSADFAGLGLRAEQVRTVSSNVQWVERFRTSSKTHQRHELSGFTGTAVYAGDLHEFLPWLAFGELIHLGKHTAWGAGWISLD
jgi:hypothetical protein